MDQFEKYESLYFDLSKKDQSFIEDTTGCLYPCSYPEYRVGDKKVYNMGTFGLYISYGSVAVTVKKEVRVKYRISPEGGQTNPTRCHKVILRRFTVTHLSHWSLTLEEPSVSSSASLSMHSGTFSRTVVLLSAIF